MTGVRFRSAAALAFGPLLPTAGAPGFRLAGGRARASSFPSPTCCVVTLRSARPFVLQGGRVFPQQHSPAATGSFGGLIVVCYYIATAALLCEKRATRAPVRLSRTEGNMVGLPVFLQRRPPRRRDMQRHWPQATGYGIGRIFAIELQVVIFTGMLLCNTWRVARVRLITKNKGNCSGCHREKVQVRTVVIEF